ncbi:hypothetical protein JG688_00009128 [Phytophthora aleatoria]|uniref:Peptidase M12A domain-containing protein n=1 Tax=Phytophthora aleatoria TaxID=2496075 RepID=A0A8J5MG11_9STRA|nr:hypothetical protein JG688_00009128 [Phytophthora aleatoria]
MLLPRDMEMIDDCICNDGVDTTAQEAAADAMDAGEFICKGRYKSKRGAPAPRSFADCDCYHPWSHSLTVRVQRLLSKSRRRDNVYAETVTKLHWGFVRNSLEACEREFAAYVCPINSVKRSDLPIGERPRGFFDCECLSTGDYQRDEEAHACWPVSQMQARKAKRKHSNVRDTEVDEYADFEVVDREATAYQCPPFSRAVATVPHSIEQCQCIPGKLQGSEIETGFEDCACARGYFLDAVAQRCSNANCKCVYGLNETIYEEEGEARRNAEDQEVVRKRRKECNTRPVDSSRPDFSQCPHDSMATTWPAESADGCTCLSGLEMTPLTEQEISRGVGDGFHCVATKEKKILADEAVAACRAPGVIHSLSGECRLPIEEIPEKKTTDTKLEGVLFKGIEYHYELVDDTIMVIQGDVAIGERFVWDDVDPADPEEVTTRIEHVLHGYYNSGRDHRWPHEKICFQVDKSARSFLRTLLSHDFVVVQGVQSSCYSFVGRIGGPQRLGVSADCGLGNVVHVLLHAVGLRHAVDRVDRDEHVRIAWECIPESKRSYFVVEEMSPAPTPTRAKDHVLDPPPYDLFSIMHHPVDAFVHSDSDDTKPQWCPSVVPLIADDDKRLAVMKDMGQRERMTTTDVKSVWALYPGLKKKHHDRQKVGESGEAQAEDLHDSFLHTDEDAVETESAAGYDGQHRGFGQRLVSFLGAVVTLVGFGAMLAFITTELRRRALLSSGDDYFYEAPLIDSKNDI